MDANGTRFHLLLGEPDWSACADASEPGLTLAQHFSRGQQPCETAERGFAWNKRGEELTLRPCVVRFEAAANDRPPNPLGADRRGAARDRFGNVYWIGDSATEIRVLPSGSGVATHFWSSGDGLACLDAPRYGQFHPQRDAAPAQALRMSGLAVTDDHHLCAGVVDPPGVLLFDLHAGGPPEQLCWPAGSRLAPFDLATRHGGGVWILDRTNRQYWGLDRHFAVIALREVPPASAPSDLFQPVTPEASVDIATRPVAQGVRAEAAAALAGGDPVAIEGLPDGSVLILDRFLEDGSTHILRYRLAERLPDIEWHEPAALTPYDFVFVPDRADSTALDGRLVLATDAGNQSFAFVVAAVPPDRLELSLIPEYLPMRLFGGKGLIASASQVFYDFFDGWIPLVAQLRPRYAASAGLQTPAFDGREPGCVWHRLLVDANIPAEARIEVRSRAADDERELEISQWQPEPTPYLRRDGSEIPFATRRPTGRDGTWELLFQRACGRYLQVEIILRGNGRVTPRLRALRAYYPRFSYLERYLPGVYREEPDSASFLDRFLANLEGFNTTIEDRVASVQGLFDHRSAPREALDWLAGWFGVALDPAWSEAKRRLFIRYASRFFQQRGTMSGLRAAIRLATDECADSSIFESRPSSRRRPEGIRIVELHRTRRGSTVAGDPTEVSGLRRLAPEARWRPSQGRADLNDRFRAWLTAAGIEASTAVFPVRQPPDAQMARTWREFSAATLGFVPSATGSDRSTWRDFLARRYQRRSALVSAYTLPPGVGLSFDTMPLPSVLPADGAPLVDWHEFESIVIAMRRTAHRFVVLLPATGKTIDEQTRRDRLDLVRRVVALEKPAHTLFEVRFYWALFRIGEARLGLDSLVDRGGRAPDLLPALRLGQAYLAESHLAPAHPHDVVDRSIVGRDAIGDRRTEERQL